MASLDLNTVDAVFTYGILQPGESLHYRIRDTVDVCVEKTYIKGYDLYASMSFPFASPSDDKEKVVWGTLLFFDKGIMDRIIEYMDSQELPYGYARIKKDVYMNGKIYTKAWVYVVNDHEIFLASRREPFASVDHGNFIKYADKLQEEYLRS